MRPRLLLPLLLAAALTTGCQTTVGNYFGNRARDFGECFMVHAGLGLGLGVEAKVGGLMHLGVIAQTSLPGRIAGWLYGEYRPDRHFLVILQNLEGDFWFPFNDGVGFHEEEGVQRTGHACYALLPALLSWQWVYPEYPARPVLSWLWSGGSGDELRKARIHAFDLEVGATAILVTAKAGFSPGEFVDFLLGWFGVDIAGNDRGLGPEEKAGEGVGEQQLR